MIGPDRSTSPPSHCLAVVPRMRAKDETWCRVGVHRIFLTWRSLLCCTSHHPSLSSPPTCSMITSSSSSSPVSFSNQSSSDANSSGFSINMPCRIASSHQSSSSNHSLHSGRTYKRSTFTIKKRIAHNVMAASKEDMSKTPKTASSMASWHTWTASNGKMLPALRRNTATKRFTCDTRILLRTTTTTWLTSASTAPSLTFSYLPCNSMAKHYAKAVLPSTILFICVTQRKQTIERSRVMRT